MTESFPQPSEPLSGDQAYNWVKTHTSKDTASLSQRAFAQGWREVGVSLANESFRDVQRRTLGVYTHYQDLARLESGDIIPRSWYYEDHGLNLHAQFSYRFQTTLQNQQTGEVIQAFNSISSWDELNVATAFAELQYQVEATNTQDYGWELVSATLVGALSKPGSFE